MRHNPLLVLDDASLRAGRHRDRRRSEILVTARRAIMARHPVGGDWYPVLIE